MKYLKRPWDVANTTNVSKPDYLLLQTRVPALPDLDLEDIISLLSHSLDLTHNVEFSCLYLNIL